MEEDYEKEYCECCGEERETDYGTYECDGKLYYGSICWECIYEDEDEE